MNRLPDRAEGDTMSRTPISPPWSMTVKVVVVVFGVVVVGAIVLRFQRVITPLVIAGLIAYVLTPMVNFVNAHTRIPRGVLTAAIYLLFFGLIALAVSLLAPLLVRQALSFQLDFRRIGASIEEFLSQPLRIGDLSFDLASVYDELISALTDLVRPLATQTVVLLAGVVSTVVEVIFVGIVSFYLTKDGPKMGRWLAQWVPPHLRYDFERLREELGTLWRAFFRGQLLLALTMGLTVGLLMAIVGMKNALILGLLAFFLEFLPSVGHGIWLAIAIPLALFQGSVWIPIPNFWVAVLVLGIHLVLQQVDLNFFIPRIVGRRVQLHPIVVIIGIIGGGLLAGVLGMLLAAPTIASAGVLAHYVHCKLLDLPPWPLEPEAQGATDEKPAARPVV
ncbi:MAG: AI-2E family transporter [Anaerolineae bacterium]